MNEAQQRYYDKNKQKIIDKNRRYRNENPEKSQAWSTKYRHKNLEAHNDYNKKWRDDNPNYFRKYYIKNKEKLLKKFQSRIVFKDKIIPLDHNPRKGMCIICGHKGHTNLHHEKYDETDPLAYTIELCIPCHRKIHKSV